MSHVALATINCVILNAPHSQSPMMYYQSYGESHSMARPRKSWHIATIVKAKAKSTPTDPTFLTAPHPLTSPHPPTALLVPCPPLYAQWSPSSDPTPHARRAETSLHGRRDPAVSLDLRVIIASTTSEHRDDPRCAPCVWALAAPLPIAILQITHIRRFLADTVRINRLDFFFRLFTFIVPLRVLAVRPEAARCITSRCR